MKIEKAIETIKSIRDVFTDNHCKTGIDAIEAIKASGIAITALEKQIPKKMILSPDCDKCNKEGTLDCTKECASYVTISPVLICPNCKRIAGIEEHQYKFCPECGQAIDLSE